MRKYDKLVIEITNFDSNSNDIIRTSIQIGEDDGYSPINPGDLNRPNIPGLL